MCVSPPNSQFSPNICSNLKRKVICTDVRVDQNKSQTITIPSQDKNC